MTYDTFDWHFRGRIPHPVECLSKKRKKKILEEFFHQVANISEGVIPEKSWWGYPPGR
jgi:hypothetical protein